MRFHLPSPLARLALRSVRRRLPSLTSLKRLPRLPTPSPLASSPARSASPHLVTCRIIRSIYRRIMSELVFEVTQEADGGFVAEALGESIITEANSWEELRANVREAVRAFYFDRPAPKGIRLHLVRDEVLA